LELDNLIKKLMFGQETTKEEYDKLEAWLSEYAKNNWLNLQELEDFCLENEELILSQIFV